MKRFLLISLLLLAALGGYVAWRATTFLSAPLNSAGGTVEFEVPRGASVASVIDTLVERDIISDPLVFALYARSQALAGDLKAGVHTIDLAGTPKELVARLAGTGRSTDIAITLPEGLNRWEIADRLGAAGLVDRTAFLAEVETRGLEGQLFPDTYRFAPNAGHVAVVERLTQRFARAAEAVGAPAEPEARRRWLTLGSLIEAEAQTERDRGLVSRVFHNRLAIKMKLQTDPTCVYGAGIYQQKPSPTLCKDRSSQYSTYVIPGLPPTPITNPGQAALRAALHPTDGPGTDKLLYFVARRDGSGEHAFSATYEAHRRAVDKYLRGK